MSPTRGHPPPRTLPLCLDVYLSPPNNSSSFIHNSSYYAGRVPTVHQRAAAVGCCAQTFTGSRTHNGDGLLSTGSVRREAGEANWREMKAERGGRGWEDNVGGWVMEEATSFWP